MAQSLTMMLLPEVTVMPSKPEDIPSLLAPSSFLTLVEDDDVVVVLDADLHYLYLNRAAERLLKRDRRDLIGKSLLQAFPDADVRSPFYEPALRALSERVEITVEGKLTIADRWFSARFQPIQVVINLAGNETNDLLPGSDAVLSSGGALPSEDRKNTVGLAVYCRDITERKRAEAEVRRSERSWTTILDALPLMVWVWGPHGEAVLVNRSFRDYTGVASERATVESWTTFIHPDDLPRCLELMARSRTEGNGWQGEFRLRSPSNGTYRWHIARCTPAHDAKGTVTSWFGMATDIHDRREAEDALRQVEERLRLALDAGEVGVIEIDCLTGQKQYSPLVFDLLGIELPEVFFSPFPGAIPFAPVQAEEFWAQVHPEDKNGVQDALRRAYDHSSGMDGVYEAEYRVGRPGGGNRWIGAKGRVAFDADNRPIRLYGMLRDITVRKEAEMNLLMVADTMPQIIWVARPDGTNFYYNRRWYEFTGMSEQDSLGLGFAAALHPEDRERIFARWEQVRADGGPYEVEGRLRRRDGEYRWFCARAKTVQDAATGETVLWVGTCTDIDDIRRAQDALHSQGEYLRRVVESSPDCLKTMDLEGRVLAMNEGGQRVMEVDDFSAICGIDWLTFWKDDDTRQAVCAALDVAKSGGTGRFQGYCPTAKGTPKWWDVLVVPLLGADGNPEQLLGVSRDVTELRRLERERELLLSEARAFANRERLLNEIGEAVRSSADPDAMQATLVERLGKALDVDRCFLTVVNASRDEFLISQDYRSHRAKATLPSLVGTYRLSDFTEDMDALYNSRDGSQSLVISDTHNPPVNPLLTQQATDSITALGLRALVNVPLYEGATLVAALGVGMAASPRDWTEHEIRLIKDVAEQARVAVNAARILERERNISWQLQTALLPSIPEGLSGISLQGFYRPALEEAGVGGDFYDVFPIKHGCTVLAVGDLSGKGLAAASQVATVRNMLRYALYSGNPLADAISSLHNIILEHEVLTGFATLFVGIYNHNQQLLTYVNCGQEPGLLWRAATEQIESLPPTGPVLGGFRTATGFTESAVDISDGDVLAIFTDGLTDVGTSRKNLMELAGVADLFQRCCKEASSVKGNRDPIEILNGLVAGVHAFGDGLVFDDIALLVGVLGLHPQAND